MQQLSSSSSLETSNYIEEAYALPERPGVKRKKKKCHVASSAITAQKPMETITEVFDTTPQVETLFVESAEESITNVATNTTSEKKRAPTMRSSTSSTKMMWTSMSFWKSEQWQAIQKKMQGDADLVPRRPLLFRPFLETPLDRVKVVLLGTEPSAFGIDGQVDGLAYSFGGAFSNQGNLPVSLNNLISEAREDLDLPEPKTGSLRRWARQGVLLWNCIPTVRKGFPMSCNKWGWEELTMEVLETAYLANPDCVFVFFDNKTRIFKEILPDGANIVTNPGPSVLTTVGFFGSKPFSRINELLKDTGQQPVDWRLW